MIKRLLRTIWGKVPSSNVGTVVLKLKPKQKKKIDTSGTHRGPTECIRKEGGRYRKLSKKNSNAPCMQPSECNCPVPGYFSLAFLHNCRESVPITTLQALQVKSTQTD